jgi:hypothetical protein
MASLIAISVHLPQRGLSFQQQKYSSDFRIMQGSSLVSLDLIKRALPVLAGAAHASQIGEGYAGGGGLEHSGPAVAIDFAWLKWKYSI